MTTTAGIREKARVRLLADGYRDKLGYIVRRNGTRPPHKYSLSGPQRAWLVQVDGLTHPMTFVESEIEAV
jgi:hypothetical protein